MPLVLMLPYPPCMNLISVIQCNVICDILNTALYPVEKTEWCVYALFIKDHKVINLHYPVESCNQDVHLATYLDGYIWAVSPLDIENIQICFLEESNLVTFVPPFKSYLQQ